MALYVIGYFENDELKHYYTNGRNCNVGCYTSLSGAKRALGHIKSVTSRWNAYKILELETFEIVE